MSCRYARIAAALCVVAGTIMSAPAPAAASTSGAIVFVCEVYFSSYPAPGGTATCGGGSVSRAQASISGIASDGEPYLVAGLGFPSLSFSHGQACVAGEPALLGTMFGAMTISDVPALHKGSLTTASISLPFSATVVGTDITFTISDPRITFGSGGGAAGSAGAGNGAYVPLIGPGNRCPQGGPMSAVMQGEIALLM